MLKDDILMRTDLIYEGIATSFASSLICVSISTMRTDLIYEGIATIFRLISNKQIHMTMRTDLIYEGIATGMGMKNKRVMVIG